MFGAKLTKSFIYKYRYFLGYAIISLGLIAVLLFAGLYLPGGLSAEETESAIKSNSINYGDAGSIAITNLPYHLLQKASFVLFGVSVFSIKLPSIILAFLSGIGLVLLLNRWFRSNIAVLGSVIAITTGQFLFIAQSGTPSVLYLFWPVWLLLLANLITTKQKKPQLQLASKVAFFVTAALSLYTPLSLYALIALATAVFLHPHLRFIIKQLSWRQVVASSVAGIIILIPLMSAILQTPSLGLSLLGVPTSWPEWGNNIAAVSAQYAGFGGSEGTNLMTPFFALGSSLLIILGIIYRMSRVRATAKSYVIVIWMLMLLPVIVINPNFTTVTFLPLVLLLASGLGALLRYWYKLFPFNPYARVAGLVPIVILVGALVFTGVDRYVYGYRYDPELVGSFSRDLKLVPKETNRLLVSEDESEFYHVYTQFEDDVELIDQPEGDVFTTTKAAKGNFKDYEISQIVTDNTATEADRFYLYKKID